MDAIDVSVLAEARATRRRLLALADSVRNDDEAADLEAAIDEIDEVIDDILNRDTGES